MQNPGAEANRLRAVALTAVAMLAFAANSIFARLALVTGNADAAGYTGVRLATGAIALAAILALSNRTPSPASLARGGSWPAAAALFGYAITFSYAYILLGAATGALILFASVQLSMLAVALYRGDRPSGLEWVGLAIAAAAFVYLVAPGLAAPHPLGSFLMIASGMSWAVYTLLGRGSRAPLADTAGNFIRCAPVAALLAIYAAAGLDARTLALATASGAIASGLGYAIWYTGLPLLTATRAAIVQLTVPAIAAAGAVAFLGEPLTARLIIASIGILGGVATAVVASSHKRK